MELKDKVSLVSVRNKEIKDSIKEAVGLVDFEIGNSVKSVTIKPNLCYYWDSSTGCTTDPMIVGCIVDWVRERWGRDIDISIVEADATAMRAGLAFQVLGYEKLAEEKGIKLLNLTMDSIVVKKVSVNGREIEFEVPQLLLESDLFINVPKLKTIRMTRITCAMKNIFGCIAKRRKIVYHPFLNEAIVGINKILRPHLTIVDGLVALGRFPVKLNLVMASKNTFSVDWVASGIMGYRPSSIAFLKIAAKEGLGSGDRIEIIGEDPDSFRKMFPRESGFTKERLWGTQIGLLKAYSRIVGDIMPPILQE